MTSDFWNVTFLPFEVTIETLEPFFYSILQQSHSFLAQTANFTDSVSNLVGNYKAQPIISITFLAGLVGVTTITLILNDKVISITGTFTDADIVTVNCETKDVALNSVGGQEYTGTF